MGHKFLPLLGTLLAVLLEHFIFNSVQIDILNQDLLLCSINLGESHWTLLVRFCNIYIYIYIYTVYIYIILSIFSVPSK